MAKRTFSFLFLSILAIFLVLPIALAPSQVFAADPPACEGTNPPSCGGLNTPPASPASGDPAVNLKNPLGENTNSVPKLIGNVINAALGIVGSLALIMFIYGGFTWMLAAGNEQAVTKGKNILIWATVGLVVIFASYSLVNFIINTGIRGGT